MLVSLLLLLLLLSFSFCKRVFQNIFESLTPLFSSCSQPSSSFSKGNSESEWEEACAKENQGETECMLNLLPFLRKYLWCRQNAAGEIVSVRVWLWFRAVPKTLLRLSKQCQNQLPTPTLTTTKKISNAALLLVS